MNAKQNRLFRFVAVAAATLGLVGAAAAQRGTVDSLQLSTDRNGIFGVEWAQTPRSFQWELSAWGTYVDLGTDSNQIDGGAVGTLGITNWLALSVRQPMLMSRKFAGTTTSFGLGDTQALLKLRLLGSGLYVAILPGVSFKTGDEAKGLTLGDIRFGGKLAISKSFGRVRFGINGGFDQGPVAKVWDETIMGAAGLGIRFGNLRKPFEFDITFQYDDRFKKPAGSPDPAMEIGGGIQWWLASSIVFFAGGAYGLTDTAPNFRGIAGLRLGNVSSHQGRAAATVDNKSTGDDADGDGIVGSADKCPDEAEVINSVEDDDGCPDKAVADKDNDGVADDADKCADEAEDKDGHEDADGCADPDNDGDGVLDGNDNCGAEAGPASNGGCPDKDGDGDGVVDRLDNCPTEAGLSKFAGCSKKQLVTISDTKLNVPPIFFKPGKADIAAKSFKTLNAVATVLGAQSQIKLRIEGHTDDQGNDEANLELSRARADAVKAYLMNKGVDEARLSAEGFGESQPLVNNTSKKARAKNRRVEFVIQGTGQ